VATEKVSAPGKAPAGFSGKEEEPGEELQEGGNHSSAHHRNFSDGGFEKKRQRSATGV